MLRWSSGKGDVEQPEREETKAETRDGRGMCSGTEQGGTKKRKEKRQRKEKVGKGRKGGKRGVGGA